MPCDLSKVRGIEFDFYCGDLSPFSSFSIYLQSGNGWYHLEFAPERDRAWQHIVLPKSRAYQEGKCAGWQEISTLRISAWRCSNAKTECAIANLSTIQASPEVTILQAKSCETLVKSESRAFLHFANQMADAFHALGVNPIVVEDVNLTEALLSDTRLLVLPYNPSIPDKALAILKRFVARGGKIMVCYSLTKETADLLHLQNISFYSSDSKDFLPISGLSRSGKGIPYQPEFSPQTSWCSQIVKPLKGAEVIAHWKTGSSLSKIPALVRSPAGYYLAHVWLGGNSGKPLQLLYAIARSVIPDFGKAGAEKAFLEIGRIDTFRDYSSFRAFLSATGSATAQSDLLALEKARNQASVLMAQGKWHESLAFSQAAKDQAMICWSKMQPARNNEHRAFWCHSWMGLGGTNTWDSSIRLLKESGFNVIHPNLCWAGTAFYRSHVLPVSPLIQKQGDALDACLAACKKYNVKCHVWRVCWNMGSYATQEQIAQYVRDKRVQVTYGGEVKEEWFCPSDPRNRKLEIDAMIELAEKGVDGIHFDYIRYSDTETCFCEGCRKRFEATLGHRVAHWPKDVRDVPEVKQAWERFRVDNISKVVRTVADYVHTRKPRVEVSAAVFNHPKENRRTIGQDWLTWLEKGWLDFACPMNYVDSPALFRNQTRNQKKLIGDSLRLYPGIGLSCWIKDGNAPIRITKQIQEVRKLGLKGYTVFNFDRNAESVLPFLKLGTTKTN